MKAQYFNKHSRAYRISEIVGGTTDDVKKEKEERMCEIGFVCERWGFMENCGEAKIALERKGPSEARVVVNYKTREGTAKAGSDYQMMEGSVVFEPGETSKMLAIPVVDDAQVEEDEEFYIDLSIPQEELEKGEARLSSISVATVVIIDNDQPGGLRFQCETMEVVEESEETTVNIIVERFNGVTGVVKCGYHTDCMNAQEGFEYEGAKGTITLEDNVRSAPITVKIKPTGRLKSSAFNVVLSEPAGCHFDKETDGGEEKCICCVTIKAKMGETRQNLLAEMKARAISANNVMGSRNWAQQFKDALFQVGEEEDEDGEEGTEASRPSAVDYFFHILSIPWKLLFAFVPPPDYCGGWACFSGALAMIAVVTAVVGDMANLVGCCFDILPETAAITFVALGTSLPDTFASKAAAVMDPYADASIGNITGSNSINVFMGIGLSWVLAAFKWQLSDIDETWTKRTFGADSTLTSSQMDNVRNFLGDNPTSAVFVTPAGTIWFNLMVFSVNAFFAIQHLYARRKRFGGELGGPKKGFMGQQFSACFLVGQWFLYVGASIAFARSGDSALSYGQIAD
jgi:solute carrier family 8 (sodium/calcium exchanger)